AVGGLPSPRAADSGGREVPRAEEDESVHEHRCFPGARAQRAPEADDECRPEGRELAGETRTAPVPSRLLDADLRGPVYRARTGGRREGGGGRL
ncbi:MAG: hypothetical protein AVDCRST_MAG22-2896, partial [uncultured Rubrobacteraceae bacterium]